MAQVYCVEIKYNEADSGTAQSRKHGRYSAPAIEIYKYRKFVQKVEKKDVNVFFLGSSLNIFEMPF